ncbi:MAG: RluA family pseudouridine synthase [Gammaproteobacteria bacterium]
MAGELPGVSESVEVPEALAGQRLDRVLVELCPGHSRTRLADLIRRGQVTVSGHPAQPSDPVDAGEPIEIRFDPPPETRIGPESMMLSIVFEDPDLIVVDKPAGLVVHPGAGHARGTLINGLLNRYPELARIPRAGLVHRLDKDTSGLLIVARSERAHAALTRKLALREIRRTYVALIVGQPVSGRRIEAPIGRHPRNRLKQAVTPGGKPADTEFRILERFPNFSWIEVHLGTGRTHQIRVHLAHIGHGLVGDPLYGPRWRLRKGMTPNVHEALRSFARQALHAIRLELHHPVTRELQSWTSPLPGDLEGLLATLRIDRDSRGPGGGPCGS